MRDDPISWSIIIFITAFFGLFMIVPLLQVMFGAFFQMVISLSQLIKKYFKGNIFLIHQEMQILIL